MAESTTTPQPMMRRMFGVFAALSVAGMVGLVVTALIGFEEPNGALFAFSCVLVLAAPLAMFVHLSVSKELTREEKWIWMRELASRRAPWAFSAYLSSPDRRSMTERLAARRGASR